MQRSPSDKIVLKSLGLRVKAIRENRGASQEALANDADVHRTYLSGVERGLRNPSLLTLARIAHALSVDLEILVDFRVDGSSLGLNPRRASDEK